MKNERMIEIALTEGMDGKVIKKLGTAHYASDAMKAIEDWKAAEEHDDEYRIEPYNRLVFLNEQNAVIVDFGDYSTFIKLTSADGSRDMMAEFMDIQ